MAGSGSPYWIGGKTRMILLKDQAVPGNCVQPLLCLSSRPLGKKVSTVSREKSVSYGEGNEWGVLSRVINETTSRKVLGDR